MSYGLLLIGSRVVNAIVNHTVVYSPSAPVAIAFGVIGFVASYVVAVWCGIRLTRGIVFFIKDRSSSKVRSGILEGVIIGLSTTGPCSLPIWRSEMWSPAGLSLCLSLQGLSFALAFYELSKLSKQASAIIGQTASQLPTRSVQDSNKQRSRTAICAAATLIAILLIAVYETYLDMPGISFAGDGPQPSAVELTEQSRIFVGNLESADLVRRCMAEFRRMRTCPSEGIIAPSFVTGANWADHRNFWHFGYPGILVTDTALYRWSWYQTPQDTADRINYTQTARTVIGLAAVIKRLSDQQ